MSLEDWLRNGWLVEHKTSLAEISDLLAIADRDLVDCRVQGLSAEWKLNIAYNAALQAATAALAACGYRASRDAHHDRVIQSLTFTIEADPSLLRRFDAFRKKTSKMNVVVAGLGNMIRDKLHPLYSDSAERMKKDLTDLEGFVQPTIVSKQQDEPSMAETDSIVQSADLKRKEKEGSSLLLAQVGNRDTAGFTTALWPRVSTP